LQKNQLKRYENEGEQNLNRIVAIDETCPRSYEPELKSQISEWNTPGSPRPAKYRRNQRNSKQLAIIAMVIEVYWRRMISFLEKQLTESIMKSF
jgi:hypothetical protein